MTRNDKKLFGKLAKKFRLRTLTPLDESILETMMDTMSLEQIAIYGNSQLYHEEELKRDFWDREFELEMEKYHD